ncbi:MULTISPECIES: hypothetical protein [Enterococcus]|uniref:hypothetical protein n=1 Tax=Enterococcus TaxID=1350 RepID=UPI00031CBB66|nr:hypothetical protein [Enterococcus mundtii]MDB7102433.1 hypothetical protein [Enterococcus mundtii]
MIKVCFKAGGFKEVGALHWLINADLDDQLQSVHGTQERFEWVKYSMDQSSYNG